MNRSFLNGLLPSDEYKKTRMLYFMAESLVINIIFLFIMMVLHYFMNFKMELDVILFISAAMLIGYPFFRYILSGMEHTEISTEKEYKKTLKEVILHSILSGVFFGLIMLVIKGVPHNWHDGLDFIFIPILFTGFYLLFEYLSLKSSYKKNKELE